MRVFVGDIASGRLQPGDWLPREADVAGQFGVSRGIARECIRGLEERGMVWVTHGRGATVTAEARWDLLDPDVLGALLESGNGAAVLGEYLECRRILEIAAAGLAAERATPDDLAALSEAVERMTATAERAMDSPASEDLYHEADIAFHRALIDAGGNRGPGQLDRADPPSVEGGPAMRDHLLTVEAYLKDYASLRRRADG